MWYFLTEWKMCQTFLAVYGSTSDMPDWVILSGYYYYYYNFYPLACIYSITFSGHICYPFSKLLRQGDILSSVL